MPIKYFAVHAPKEHPDFGFSTRAEAKAFIWGYGLGCGHDGAAKPCEGGMAEWHIEDRGDMTAQ
jgi:hypothetical protein